MGAASASTRPRLKVRIGDHFRDRQYAAGLECFENFPKRHRLVWELSEHSDEDGAIEGAEMQFTVSDCDLLKVDIGKTGPFGRGLRAGEHSGLQVESDNAAIRPDLFRHRNGQAARSAADVEHAHSRPQIKMRDDRLCLGAFEKRIVALYKPESHAGQGIVYRRESNRQLMKTATRAAASNDAITFDTYRRWIRGAPHPW
jgi:hypothetical protein